MLYKILSAESVEKLWREATCVVFGGGGVFFTYLSNQCQEAAGGDGTQLVLGVQVENRLKWSTFGSPF